MLWAVSFSSRANVGSGLVKIAAANMRSAPSHASELVSQAVMGTPLKLIDRTDDWYLVESPDGYRGYMIANSIKFMSPREMNVWKRSHRVMYTDFYTGRIISQNTPISDITSGSVLKVVGDITGDSLDVILPDGRKGKLSSKTVTDLDSLGTHMPNSQAIIDMAKALMGVSYLWGGTTTSAMDCSGLSKICYLNQGIILKRDASEQFLSGRQLGTDYRQFKRGDLIFFKSAKTGKIVHVGIYDSNGLYVHCSGRVKINSLDPSSHLYIPSNILAGAICVIPDSVGIIPIVKHSSYFHENKVKYNYWQRPEPCIPSPVNLSIHVTNKIKTSHPAIRTNANQ